MPKVGKNHYAYTAKGKAAAKAAAKRKTSAKKVYVKKRKGNGKKSS